MNYLWPVLVASIIIIAIVVASIIWNVTVDRDDYRLEQRRLIPSSKRIAVLTIMYHKIVDILDANKIEYWLYFGTLLGAIREGKLICYDFDLDFALFNKDNKRIKKLLKEFIKNNPEYYLDTRCYPLEMGCFLQLVHKETDLNADFAFWYKDTRRGNIHRGKILKRIRGNKQNKVKMSKILPLRRINFLGRQTYVPNESNMVLRQIYGSNYMTPSEKCDINCDNCVSSYI